MCVGSSNVLCLRLLGLVLVDAESGFQLGEEASEEGGQHWMDDVDRLSVGVLGRSPATGLVRSTIHAVFIPINPEDGPFRSHDDLANSESRDFEPPFLMLCKHKSREHHSSRFRARFMLLPKIGTGSFGQGVLAHRVT
jgi:hypothetical protein